MRKSWRRLDKRLLGCVVVAATVAPLAAVQSTKITIDLRPDDPPPTIIAPRSQGMLPVGILTTSTFDAVTIAAATIRLGVTGTEAPPVRIKRADVDGDGDTDLQVFFAIQELGVACGDTTLVLKARTTDGLDVEGSAPIVTEGCG